jgi:citrate lyase beta subunit
LPTFVASDKSAILDIIDGVYNDFKDELGLREECERGRTLGMDGKTLIHPSQIAPCNEVFSPTEEEVDWSRKKGPCTWNSVGPSSPQKDASDLEPPNL